MIKINIIMSNTNSCADSSKAPDVVITLSIPKEKDTQAHKRLPSPTKSNCSIASCRICHEGESLDNLIAPCECTGTVALIHKNCLETWLSISNTDFCEICQFQFKVVKEKRPLKEWLTSESGPAGPFGVFSDALCIVLLTPLCFVSSYICSAGAMGYFTRGFWPGIGLAIVGMCVIIAYSLWVYMTVRFHMQCLATWRASNPVIRLVPNTDILPTASTSTIDS